MSELSRREVIAAGAAAGALLALEHAGTTRAAAQGARAVERIDFAAMSDGEGWGERWRTVGVANLRRAGGEGLLEAGSDVFPNDPRPIAFAVDCRLRDGRIAATVTRVGTAPGVVLRRTSPRTYYAAVCDTGARALRILRRDGTQLDELASTPLLGALVPLVLSLEVRGRNPTALRAEVVDAAGVRTVATGEDDLPALQRAGDPGVLATAETLFPSESNPVLPALGNLHLLPWSVQEGQAFMATPVGQEVVGEIRRRSTAGFREITVSAVGRRHASTPSVVAATTGRPVDGGAELHVASDLPAQATIELSDSHDFRRFRTVAAGRTDRFGAVTKAVRGLRPGRRVYWRPRLQRAARTATGPVRSFRVPPDARDGRAYRIAVAACGSQFGPIFEHLAAERPNALIWQGDLNYPDTHGPLAQTTNGYAGIWRDFLSNPLLEPVLERAAFGGQRDDHDYGVQDANATNVADFPWGLDPWTSLMSGRVYYRFSAGAADVWVLDQRLWKTDPSMPDGPEKTLLGARQRRWLLDGLARSRADFKLICSPCTLFMPGNARDGNWSAGFEAERDLLVQHIRQRVSGTTLFLTGDLHLTGVYEADGNFEVRAAPVGIPKPNDITLVNPLAAHDLSRRPGVAYAGDECHFSMLEVSGRRGRGTLHLRLVREDGAVPYERRFMAAATGAPTQMQYRHFGLTAE